jgi:hypothetical protein
MGILVLCPRGVIYLAGVGTVTASLEWGLLREVAYLRGWIISGESLRLELENIILVYHKTLVAVYFAGGSTVMDNLGMGLRRIVQSRLLFQDYREFVVCGQGLITPVR